ncbi:MAG: SH3 domain-containing protein [Proteobacteria bacterium]|nr:SH3 domain-containing protein [Pseudomonadota bacterium]
MSKVKTRNILTATAGVFLLVGALQATPANAETRTTTKKTKVYKRQGESSPVLVQVPARVAVKIIKSDGRWVKVRYKGRTGWMTRTSLTATRSARTRTRVNRRSPFVTGRSKRRGWATAAPRDRVGGDVVDMEEDEDDSDFLEEEDADAEAEELDEEGDDEELLEEDDGDMLEEDDGEVRTAAKSKRKKKKRKNDDDFDDDDDGDTKKKKNKANTVQVIVEEAGVYKKKSRRSGTVMRVDEGMELTVLRTSKSGKWLRVRGSSGGVGWIHVSKVSKPAYQYPKMLRRGIARLGYTLLSQEYRPQGQQGYNISSPAATLLVGGELLYRYKPKYMVGVDLSYRGSRASPGIRVEQQGQAAVDIGFTTHEINLGVLGGYNFQHPTGLVVYGRLGYHYGFFGVHDVEDTAQNPVGLPSEALQGLTLGVRADVPQIREKMGFDVGLNLIALAASRKQTEMLEYGAFDGTLVVWLTGNFVYRWKPNLDIEAGYRLNYANSDWNGLNGQQGSSKRKDTVHLVTVGVGRNF